MIEEEREEPLNEADEPQSAEPSDGRRRRRRARPRRQRGPRSGDLFLFVLVFLLVVIFFAFGLEQIIDLFYNKTAGLILIVIVVEFLILKSMDRTRVYQMENARLREQRRADRALLKRAVELLEEATDDEAVRRDDTRRRLRHRAEVMAEELRERL
ncbi:MAG: hypothetical protein KF858_15915 [Candidatus Sumerlaeia bacterium]|nr:hypothetical protein [Candidatus Sumerlaeia bacterium]